MGTILIIRQVFFWIRLQIRLQVILKMEKSNDQKFSVLCLSIKIKLSVYLFYWGFICSSNYDWVQSRRIKDYLYWAVNYLTWFKDIQMIHHLALKQ